MPQAYFELPPEPEEPPLVLEPPEVPAVPESEPPAALGEEPDDLARLDLRCFLDFLADFFGVASVVAPESAEVPEVAAGEEVLLPLLAPGEEDDEEPEVPALPPIAPLPLDELPLGDAEEPELLGEDEELLGEDEELLGEDEELELLGDEPELLMPEEPDEPELLMPEEPDEPDEPEPEAEEPLLPDEPDEPMAPEDEPLPLLGVEAEVPVPPAMPASLPVPAPVAPVALCDFMVGDEDDGELVLLLPDWANAMEDTEATTINDSERSVVFNVISNSFN